MTIIVSWLRLSAPQRALSLEAAVWIALAWLLVVCRVPMRYWRRHLEEVRGNAEGGGRRPLGRAVGRMVRRVARRLPFEVLCLPKAMAAHWMLRRRGVSSRLWIGVRRAAPGSPLEYHAWLTVNGESVIGGRLAGEYVPLPCPPWPAARDGWP